MSDERGKQKRPPPKRNGALKLDLPFDVAVKAALETRPPPKESSPPSGRNVKTKLDE